MADGKIATVTVDVLNVPELIYNVRNQCADMLREEADSEANPRIARRLRELAAAFEVGARD